MSRGRRSCRGFTLVETLVSLAILSASLIVTYSAVSGALALANRIIARDEVIGILTAAAADMRTHQLTALHGLKGETAAYSWSLSLTPMRAGSIVPLHVVGVITGKRQGAEPEIILDTIFLAPGS